MTKMLIITGPKVLSFGVINDRITNLFNDLGSYLSVFINLEPVGFKNNELNFYVS